MRVEACNDPGPLLLFSPIDTKQPSETREICDRGAAAVWLLIDT